MNSAGLVIATLMVIFNIPSRISLGVMVDPSPISTSKASSGDCPANKPDCHWLVKKLETVALRVDHVVALLGAKTNASAANFILCSKKVMVLLTLT